MPYNYKKTILDTWNGYQSVRLQEEDQHLTTFLSIWGRYKYCNLHYGYMASGDDNTTKYKKITQGFERMERCVDDNFLWDANIEKKHRPGLQVHHQVLPGRHHI